MPTIWTNDEFRFAVVTGDAAASEAHGSPLPHPETIYCVGGFGAEGAAGAPGAEGALGAAGAPASGADSDAGSIPSRLVLQKGHFFGSSP